jgi:RNA polymerase sigma factor (sigma-70 family)
MPDVSDMELLRDYNQQRSEEAFAALVQRHVSLVYSVALRHVEIAVHAEEITQTVFVILARKAASLRGDTILEGWLYETTRLTALSFLRGERRRQFREQEAYMQSTLQGTTDASTWNQLAPLLDEAVSRLGKKDRDAVMLRFFKDRSLREVAAALRVNEAAAQKRVLRAVEKLRLFLTKRGVVLPAAVLTAAISANSVQAAPAVLAKTATAIAIAKGAAANGSTLTLINGALKVIAWTKANTAVVVGVIGLLAVGTATTYINVTRDASPAELVEAPPPEPEYEGKTLREWIAATPPLNIISLEDIMSYRRTALKAMGEPAVRYLHWMVAHPHQALDEHNAAPDRLSQRLPWRRQKLPNSSPDLANFMNAVVALQWIGPSAREAVPDLVRLWESTGNPMYSHYNGFPLALAALGDASPETLAALHRHYMSSDRPHFQTDRLHRVLCAFAAWRLNPSDQEATAVLRREFMATDSEVHPRYALLETFWRYGTNASPFLPEIRKLIAASIIAKPEYQSIAARAAWHILDTPEPAAAAIQRLGTAAVRPEATTNDVNRFTASALDWAEVPGVRELSVPILKELSHYPDASAATYAENVLDRLEAAAHGRTTSPP